jgi:hypothetical protein
MPESQQPLQCYLKQCWVADLLAAAASTVGFWDNPQDDEDWNETEINALVDDIESRRDES